MNPLPPGAPDASIAFASIADLGRMLRARQLSSLELTKFYTKRLEEFGPRLNSVVTLMPERALAEAAQADQELAAGTDRGPLHGIPYGAKDLFAAKGAPTTWGATIYRHQSFDFDATAIERLTAAGAVLLAKLAMIELAGGMGYNQADASFSGPCKTPWNLNYWSGGSSSGSGASVAAGLVPFALGSETDGSITNPSSYCGISGLRPTYGRVSRFGAMTLCWTLDKVGPLCRSANDTATVLAAIGGFDPKDFTSARVMMTPPHAVQSARAVATVQPKRWRIGTVSGAREKLQADVKRNFTKSLEVLNHVADVVHLKLPAFPYEAMIAAVLAGEAASAFRAIIEDGRVQQLKDPAGRRGGYTYLTVSAVDYIDAMRQRAALRPAFEKLFENVDVLAAPTFSTVALPVGVSFDKAYPGTNDGDLITACNLVGYPAIAVPNGFGLHDLPTSLMLVGRPFSEHMLAEVAAAYQERTPYHKVRPPIFS
ncbi:MAG: amidase [Candidatus Eremiobacteraeota bacterium]|nr:amidase [Candidatus Eremiobacteraeota bacterium]